MLSDSLFIDTRTHLGNFMVCQRCQRPLLVMVLKWPLGRVGQDHAVIRVGALENGASAGIALKHVETSGCQIVSRTHTCMASSLLWYHHYYDMIIMISWSSSTYTESRSWVWAREILRAQRYLALHPRYPEADEEFPSERGQPRWDFWIHLREPPCLTNQKWGFNMGLTNSGNILCVQFLQSFLSSTCQAAALSMAQAAHSWHSLEGEGLEESLSLTICTFNVLCERFEKKILKDGWQLEVENRNGTCLLTKGVCFKCNECSGINSLFPLCPILTYSCRAWQNGCCQFDPGRVVWIERLKHTS